MVLVTGDYSFALFDLEEDWFCSERLTAAPPSPASKNSRAATRAKSTTSADAASAASVWRT